MTVSFTNELTVELLDYMGGEAAIAEAARVSTLGERSKGHSVDRDRDRGLVGTLHEEGHGVPFESTVFRFYIHAPIFVTRQLLKHRIASINEESGRYRELQPVFYIPSPDQRLGQVGKPMEYQMVQLDSEQVAEDLEVLKAKYTADWEVYQHLIHVRGWSRESAREVLPLAIYSSMHMLINLSSLLNLLSKRVDWGEGAFKRSHPQAETQRVALQMAQIMASKLPGVWDDFERNGFMPL